MRKLRVGLLVAAIAMGLGYAVEVAYDRHASARVSRREPAARPLSESAVATPSVRASPVAFEAPTSGPLRYIAIGGGATPESTEVSLEQDLKLAQRAFAGGGALFFAGGADALTVRVLHPALATPSVLVRVGELFAPRAGRSSRYRKPELPVTAATAERVMTELQRALGEGAATQPLLLYVAAHGEQGSAPRENHVTLWNGEALGVVDLAEIHEAHAEPRPLRLVVASCFSGGFADLAFQGADEARGITRAPRCGLFAGTWDRETSGCDPNPDRRAQEGYSLHVLHALRGEDRHAQPLALAELDYDGDGRVSLLEAHTRARIASTSIDVPTSTSERYLRHVVAGAADDRRGKPAAGGATLLPEDSAVVAQLGARLGVTSQAQAQGRYGELEAKLDELDKSLLDAEEVLEHRRALLAGALLARFPVLDDAYHPDFHATLRDHEAAIAALLESSDAALAYGQARATLEALDARYLDLQLDEAVLTRLLRAYDTLELAAELSKRGGQAFEHYRTLLACERSFP